MKNENYTPKEYINLVNNVFGKIDLDPFSCEKANSIVEADRYFDIDNDALKQPWYANTLFMNPPYSGGLFKPAIEKFINEYNLKHFYNAIVLTNNNTETEAGQMLLRNCKLACFPDHRINFLDENLKPTNSNRYAQIFFLFTNDIFYANYFEEEFSLIGTVLIR